jgi:hypothetical protein
MGLAAVCAGSAADSRLRFDSIRGGQKELGITLGYGENHRIPANIKNTFSFDVAKARYGWFTSPRHEIGVDFAYAKPDRGLKADSLTCTVAYRRHFLVRGSTMLAFDIGAGITWFDSKIALLATTTNFTELAGLAFQRAIGPASALTLEYRFTHTSNANTARPNVGVNASTLGVGVSWYP